MSDPEPPSNQPPATESSPTPGHVFVTVGSTRFDELVQAVLDAPVLGALRARGHSRLVVQCGNSEFDAGAFARAGEDWVRTAENGLEITVWRFKPSLEGEYEHAELVISHAGSGTILDVLRLGKPLIVVPNPSLLDNHQEELATALASLGHLKAATIAGLPEAIVSLADAKLVPFPPFNGSRFRELLDEEMGYLPSDSES
ncbi:glycosyltransferase family 1 protein [Wolfiporia cocos MD-104 SS10]|uniref:UDP-N-acetylglucosamine transferase subunit ALG13 n=1 Tax=Wolfiporia cocos (strain MD-104) TaxID=742152 RepID=A0A2H3J8S5_WOLCO|nr:glycosyltransferase family 1 protein [Wolfiporia cocos MD-104 SS10]